MRRATRVIFVLCLVSIALGAAPCAGREPATPAARNFFFVLDNSATMGLEKNADGVSHLRAARTLMLRMNERMPELGYNVGLALTSPFEVYSPLGRYDRFSFGYDVRSVYVDWRHHGQDGFTVGTTLPLFWTFGGWRADLGDALLDLEPVLSRARGRTVVVLLTAGCNRQGVDPVRSAKALYDRRPDMRLHVVSYASTDGDADTLAEVAGLEPTSVLVRAEDLDSREQLGEFLEVVLFGDLPPGPGRLYEKMVLPESAEAGPARGGAE
ncbi:MAG: vWA domain-containing protein [Desulfovibrionaceae bacterium]